jgi:TonB family protein
MGEMASVAILALLLAQISPSPAPTDCGTQQARVKSVARADVPDSFWQMANLTQRVSVLVSILIAPDGSIKGAVIWKSSGFTVLDEAALRSARLSVYAPKMVDCAPVYSNYLFRADFAP